MTTAGPLAAGRFASDEVSGAATGRLDVGSLRIIGVSDGFLTMSPGLVGDADSPTGGWDELARVYRPPRLPLGCFVVPGRTTVLVDTGMGPVDFGGRGTLVGGGLVAALAAAGFTPQDIDVVALTHLHADHSGNLADHASGELIFPDAQVVLGRGDWDYFLDGPGGPVPVGDHTLEALRRLRSEGRLELVDGEWDIVPGVRRLDGAGHTPGHSLYRVHDDGQQVLLVGDAMHCPAQLAHPGWGVPFDVDAAAARHTRERIVAELRGTGGAALGSHFPSLVPLSG